MKVLSYLILLTYCQAWVSCGWLESLSSTVTNSAKTLSKNALKLYDSGRCLFDECCNEDYIPGDVAKLHYYLSRRVYGQHLVEDVVISAIESHWSKVYQPPKALTLSFHGWPGGGKNYVSKFIMDSLYKLGDKSSHVHLYVARLHFPLDTKVKEYQETLYKAIKESVSRCEKQLFIFDEVDKMPPGILNVIKPMVDYHNSVDGVDYRRAIFIFLSNTGASVINERYLELWKNEGLKREDLRMSHFEQEILTGAFNEEGGFHKSDTIRSNLIDHYIPFLPLERQQVRLCVLDEFKLRGIMSPEENHIKEAMDFVDWGPSGERLFSKTGCKRISQKVGALAAKHYKNYSGQKNEL